ncbi:alpha-beta hydrolase superfamily lysophospholipase [Paenibacillus turicensis]|uniref:Alpha-beta hydrolase superfamily lysophospholipase n=1 Tax=Paenibacillus turicensis TaxID=160487 RepID=A0ABS4FRJ3_9BACL|nr:alpha/beta hydrolase [Paenibacillus turicensis]MBP1905198.1 alpha-beta hydrolase superfamily lysophospholipase [Paenibacillus turicensis]
MTEETYTLLNDVGHFVHIYHWFPSTSDTKFKGVVHIAHGMAESAERYAPFAQRLTDEGFIVYAHDHRGHGKTAPTMDDLGYLGNNGLEGMLDDMKLIREWISDRHPNLPLFLFGHSMGSFLTQKMMCIDHDPYAGFLLSGTNGPRAFTGIALNIAKLECKWYGDRHPSKVLNALSFGSFNHNFRPVRTPFDWLSRDEQVVDAYMENPYCGFLCSAGFFAGLFALLHELHKPAMVQQLDPDKPVYIVSGSQDPVSHFGVGIRRLVQLYHSAGLRDVEVKVYEGGRHEILNEINRDEVIGDILTWLNKKVQ